MAFESGTAYPESDADDEYEYERSGEQGIGGCEGAPLFLTERQFTTVQFWLQIARLHQRALKETIIHQLPMVLIVLETDYLRRSSRNGRQTSALISLRAWGFHNTEIHS